MSNSFADITLDLDTVRGGENTVVTEDVAVGDQIRRVDYELVPGQELPNISVRPGQFNPRPGAVEPIPFPP